MVTEAGSCDVSWRVAVTADESPLKKKTRNIAKLATLPGTGATLIRITCQESIQNTLEH